jgi:hypothetical protein
MKIILLFIFSVCLLLSCESPSKEVELEVSELYVLPELYEIDKMEKWTSNHNPYRLEKDVKISGGGQLIIDEGVEIYLYAKVIEYSPAGNYLRYPIFDVQDGSIICKGSEENKISIKDSIGNKNYGIIEFRSNSKNLAVSIIEGLEAQTVRYWDNRDINIKYSSLSEVGVYHQGNNIELISNIIDVLLGSSSSGIIKDNLFNLQVNLRADSLLFTNNILKNMDTGLQCSGNSRAKIIGNEFINCKVGLRIFSATPTIHLNNFIENEVNIALLPEWNNPKFDTIHAEDNWWGFIDSLSISSKIKYEKNGETLSGKYVKFVPFSKDPFN